MPPCSSNRIRLAAIGVRGVGTRYAAPHHHPSDGLKVEATAIVAAFEHDPSTPARDADADFSDVRLAGPLPRLGTLDAVRHGVADQLDQCALYRTEHMRIEAHLAASGHEFHLLAQGPRGVERGPFENGEQASHRHQTQPLGGVTELLQLTVHLVDGRSQAAFDRADLALQFVSDRVQPFRCAAMMPLDRQLGLQHFRQPLCLLQPAPGIAQPCQQPMGLRHPVENHVHLDDIGPDGPQGFVRVWFRRGERRMFDRR